MRTRLLLITAGLLLASCSSSAGQVSSDGSDNYASIDEMQLKAAEGDRIAQFNLGALYQEGEGVTKDLEKARTWFEKAAEQGEPRAQFNLGVMYYNGETVPKDYARAYEWFKKAMDQGNERATFNVGVMFYRGESMAQDFERAKELFEKAAYAGVPESQFNLAVMHAKGESTPVDPVEAYAWFSIAAENGDEKAVGIQAQAKPKLTREQLQEAEDRIAELREDVKKS